MKAFCVIGNYDAPANGRTNFFLLTDTSVYPSRKPFFLPDFDDDFRLFPSVALRIDRLGKAVAPKFAGRYFADACMALSVRACSLYDDLAAKGLPVDQAVGFDASFLTGPFLPAQPLLSADTAFYVNGKQVAVWNPSLLSLSPQQALAFVSQTITLRTGDLIAPGVPPEGFPVRRGDIVHVETPLPDADFSIRIK